MSTRWMFLAFLVTALLAARGSAETVSCDQDFSGIADGGLPPGWEAPGGGWSVQGGVLIGSPVAGERVAALWLPELDVSSVALEVEVAFVSADEATRWFGMVVREGKDTHGPQLTVRRDSKRRNGIELARRGGAPGGRWRLYQTGRGEAWFDGGAVQTLRLEASGAWISGLVGGRRVLQFPDAQEGSARGRSGLVVDGAKVRVRRLRVLTLEAVPAAPNAPARTPLVVAHRGASAAAPENTLAAFRQAVAAGADLAECDVRLTADGEVVLLHDEKLARTTGLARRLSEVPLEEVRGLDAGAWKGERWHGEHVPTLRQTLEVVRGWLTLVVEIKDPESVERVLAELRATDSGPDEVLLLSFYRDALERARELAPELPAVWLAAAPPWQEERQAELVDQAVATGLRGLGLPFLGAYPSLVRRAQAAGLQVFVWTVDDEVEMRALVRLGVDAIITNRPRACRRVLFQHAPPASVDLRPLLRAKGLTPRRQGRRGTCSVFTTCSALELALGRHRASTERLSPEFLNWSGGQATGRPSDGNFFHNLLVGFERSGVCREESFPYQDRFDAALAPSAAAIEEADDLTLVSKEALAVHWIVPWRAKHSGVSETELGEIRRVLASGYPVAAGSHHSRLLVGYRDDGGAPGGGTFLTMDSGSGRFDEVSYEFVRKKVADVFWVEAQ